MTFKASPAQQAFYNWVETDSGNCILNAVAGAGKTTTILNGIARMKGKVWFGVYNKKMATEIKEKLEARKDLKARTEFKASDRVESSTFHSLGLSLLRSAVGKGVKVDVDEKKVERIVDRLIAEREAVEQQRRDDLRDIAGAVTSIVSMAKNRGFVGPKVAAELGLTDASSTDAWMSMLETFDLLESIPEGLESTAIKFARAVLMRSNEDMTTVDMDDMVYLPLARNVRLAPWHMFDWVLVDEAQDTNPTRRALARKVMSHRARLVAVGDPHQAIFGFTGADNDSLQQIRDAFNAKELPLTVTYRCPKAVVEHARQWVSHITAHESAPEGEVLTQPYGAFVDSLPMIDRAHYGETAILCRYNKYLVGLCFKMIRMGLPAKIEGRSIGEGLVKLATRWKAVKTVNGLETKLREYEEREVAKALAKQQESKADRITDEVATLLTIIERVRANNADRVEDVVACIEEIFADGVAGKGLITLCSAHKSKGLEWETVYILDREALMPSKFAKQDWQVEQERNLIYVAVTRAKAKLVEVTGVVEEKDPTKEAA
ncbi:ATP-dependent DNA helicase [Pseudanabaena phage Pan1]|nr:ATP-dependent DNA helicase [Pseudanabaena phage Pan1]